VTQLKHVVSKRDDDADGRLKNDRETVSTRAARFGRVQHSQLGGFGFGLDVISYDGYVSEVQGGIDLVHEI
jgi:hypothetical protein